MARRNGFQRVIDDVVESFLPSMNLEVSFNGNEVINGSTLKPLEASQAPKVEFEGQQGHLYTLLFLDPDMPSPTDPTMKDYIHWIVTNIPGSGTVEQGMEVLYYTMPVPERGIHRYIFMMYEQTSRLGLVDPPIDRANFDTKAFALEHDLGDPKAIVYFVAKKEPRRR